MTCAIRRTQKLSGGPIMSVVRNAVARASIIVLAATLVLPVNILGQGSSQSSIQNRVVAPSNPYSLDKDIQVGQQATREVERQMPLLQNREVESYIEELGQNLVRSIPQEFQHSQFRYSFKVINVRDLNAFALPGGFTFVNRGLIQAAHNEGELVGAMAHEISHVALRHGTAQAAKARKYEAGMIAGQILGAVLGGSGPQWMSDHPNPGNRFDYINREADALRVQNPIHNTDEFMRVQAILRDMSRA